MGISKRGRSISTAAEVSYLNKLEPLTSFTVKDSCKGFEILKPIRQTNLNYFNTTFSDKMSIMPLKHFLAIFENIKSG